MELLASTPARLALAATVLLASSVPTLARPDTRAYTCAQNRGIVTQYGAIVMSTGPHSYDRIVLARNYCQPDEFLNKKYVPSIDLPRCFIGYVCKNHYE